MVPLRPRTSFYNDGGGRQSRICQRPTNGRWLYDWNDLRIYPVTIIDETMMKKMEDIPTIF